MRIAIVSDFYLDYVGGAQSSIVEQKAALESAGHSVIVIANARRQRGDRVQTDGAGGLRIRPSWTVPGVVLPVVGARDKLVRRLERHLREQQVDVVHLQTEFGLAHAVTRAARQAAIPVVHTVHTFYWQSTGWWPTLVTPILTFGLQNVTEVRFPKQRFTPRPSDNLLRNLTLAMARRVDVVVSPSEHQASDLRAAGVPVPVEVVPNPIARSPRPAVELTAESARTPRLLWVARCEPEKRPLVFADAALEALRRTGGGFAVDFVGDGSELAALRRRAEHAPQITVHGSLPHERVLDLIDDSAAVVLTSVGFDNQPMTIAEAVSRRRGVLYCDPKLREGLQHAGHLTDGTDAGAIADAIVALVERPEELLRMSRGAAIDGELFSAAGYVKRIEAIYRLAGAL